MTNEQAVIQAEAKIESLKQAYMDHLNPIVMKIHEKGENPSLQDLLTCQKLGVSYFNFIENFVGNSGLLGAHVNGKWVTGFAETCYSVLKAFVVHVNFLRSHSETLLGALENPDDSAYANMQRMTKKYLPKEKWEKLERLFKENALPVVGFNCSGANDLIETPKWQLIAGLVTGLLFALIILLSAIFIPNPTPTQFFIFRGIFAVSLAAIAAIIPGLLTVESRFQKFSVRATGAIAVFVIVWGLNPPQLIGS
ncbi:MULTISPECIES: hypothetical protein [Halomonas]|uniref:hypothetical protein n=1 Tax=Halomonas TaxID=2745 RepID=UPI001C9623B9|nr:MULTISPECIES: hypothetical protein [Halomonas]MBY6209373.1 hypothetical protein [Halomonas sp. DP3Y7-2]MBY6229528.1 hypothetical protein [Halomonas sp. DP3Y7-1]MCA0917413.1 hypothetical protein [Halomonas denitrificans]